MILLVLLLDNLHIMHSQFYQVNIQQLNLQMNKILWNLSHDAVFFTGKFRTFDYAVAGNMKNYGQEQPPDYNLGNVSVPVALYYGTNDAVPRLTFV